MDLLLLGIIIFLFVLAVFDLSVGVSNDAVNFINSAIGSKAAKFQTVIIVAAAGILVGAASSNGMMDIARHGIFRPEHFSFFDLICIFMAVMVTDIILLDVFNSLGMPTSTTVSMVFELLGAAFVIALLKIFGDEGPEHGANIMQLLNTEKALSVILGIFLSVAIAFVFGSVVQFFARLIFSFEYKSHLKWKIGIYGGLATTAIIYFLLIKGIADLSWLSSQVKTWIGSHTALLLAGCFAVFTLVMQGLHALGANVLKIVVLIGTFALAMAFAGNDLVNFIGVPLSGFASYTDYMANGSGDPRTFMMASLNEPAQTPFYFLIGAGLIMVVSLATSKKTRNVSKTEIGLGSKDGGDEMFGSSKIAQKVVRAAIGIHTFIQRYIPRRLREWIDNRFDSTKSEAEEGASFDLVRGSVNLMLAGVLIAVGTSMKLPLSTTFVTFMVAMGTSLADRAWGRESAVFRITGVISVIGGWFITAGVAFIGAAIIALLMHFGGTPIMIIFAALTVVFIVRSNVKFKEKKDSQSDSSLLHTIVTTKDKAEMWNLLKIYITEQQKEFLAFATKTYGELTQAFVDNDVKTLNRMMRELNREKDYLKSTRRKETICMRMIAIDTAIENSTWFHMGENMCLTINHNLARITEACKEHVENNFHPLPDLYSDTFAPLRLMVGDILADSVDLVANGSVAAVADLRKRCDDIKERLSDETHHIYDTIQIGDPKLLSVSYVYMNLLQESQEIISALRKLLRASIKLREGGATYVRQYAATISNA